MTDFAYLTIRKLPRADRDGLAIWAATEGRSLNAQVLYILSKALAAYERKPTKRAKGKR